MGFREALATLAVLPVPSAPPAEGTAKSEAPQGDSPDSPGSPALGRRRKRNTQRHAHLCTECGRFAFPKAGVLCYWCRRAQDNRPISLPCDGCGEVCERCLGHPVSEVEHDRQ